MGETLSWWLVVEAMGLVAFPLVYLFFPRLPDRGYAFTKAFGILIIGYLFWVLGTAWVLPNTAGGIIWTMIIVAVPSGLVAWRRKDEIVRYLDEKWTLLLIIEVLFFLAFIFAAFLRSYVPEIAGTEKPMDFAFLNASTRSEHFPPGDPWLSGHSISYYYGGYFLVAMIGKLAAVDTSVGFNLGLAMTAALAVIGAFGLVYNLVVLHGSSANPTKVGKPGKPGKPLSVLSRPVLFGLGAAVLLVVIGNLEGLLEFLAAHGIGGGGFWEWVDIKGLSAVTEHTDKWYPTEHWQNWWWWRAARIVSPSAPETITEFPFFSFLLGDLHPHVMALPFGLLGVAAGLRLLQEEERLDVRFWARHSWLLVGLALLLGGLSFLNTWDLPTFFVLLAAVALVRNFLTARRWDRRLVTDTLGFAVPLAVAAVILYVPYHKGFIPQFGFASQADGIDPVVGGATLPFHALIMWGPFAVLVIPFAVQRLLASARVRAWQQRDLLTLVPGLLVVLLWLLWVAAKGELGGALSDRGSAWLTDVVLLLVLSLFLLTLWRELESDEKEETGRVAVLTSLILSSLAVLLILGAEFFFIKDVFANRMNTVFKLYYQAWLLLAVGGGFALYYLSARWLPRRDVAAAWRVAWGAAAVVVLGAALLYPLQATFSRTDGFDGPRGLDGLAWAAKAYPGDYKAARWLAENVDGQAVVVEMVGSQSISFEYGIAGRIAGWTGHTTILAWPGHEAQWRGSYGPFEGRQGDVDRLYTTESTAEVADIVRKYNVDYIYVGELERQTYPAAALEKFDGMYGVAYREGDVVIYRVKGTR
jgi:YYY domain-containing protein